MKPATFSRDIAYSRSPAASRASPFSLNSSAWMPLPPRMPFRARRVWGSGIRSPVLGQSPCRWRSFTPPLSARNGSD